MTARSHTRSQRNARTRAALRRVIAARRRGLPAPQREHERPEPVIFKRSGRGGLAPVSWGSE